MTPEKINQIVLKHEDSKRVVFATFFLSLALFFSIPLWPKEPVLLIGLCQIFLVHVLGVSFFASIAFRKFREINSSQNTSNFWFSIARTEEWIGTVMIFIMLILLALSFLIMSGLFIYEYS